jgi:hypothetical protein
LHPFQIQILQQAQFLPIHPLSARENGQPEGVLFALHNGVMETDIAKRFPFLNILPVENPVGNVQNP